MNLHKPMNDNDLNLLFAAGGATEARKAHVLNRLNEEPRVFRKRLSHREMGMFMKQHMNAVQRYVLDAGKGWGNFDRSELIATAVWWKKIAGNQRMGVEIKNRVSKTWGLLEELEQKRLAGGGLEGHEFSAWCKGNKALRLMGFRFVQERMDWQSNYQHVLQITPPLIFRDTFPQAKVGESSPKFYLCRTGNPFEVVGVLPDAPNAFDWEGERLVMN